MGRVRPPVCGYASRMTDDDTLHLGDDEAKLPGAPAIAGEGENICSTCGGSGEKDGAPCPECDGKGIVVEKIAGG